MKVVTQKIWFPGLILIFALTVSNCRREAIIPEIEVPTVCFEEEVLPTLITNCAQKTCHSAADSSGGYVFDSYSNVVKKGVVPGNADQSMIYQAIVRHTDRMPQGLDSLTSIQTEKIATWINENATYTICTDAPCDTSVVTFSATVLPILNLYCNNCHHTGGISTGGIDLTKYDDVKAQASGGYLLGTMRHDFFFNPMPRGGNKIPDCAIEKVSAWVNRGAKDD